MIGLVVIEQRFEHVLCFGLGTPDPALIGWSDTHALRALIVRG
jgi:hypothetical protein